MKKGQIYILFCFSILCLCACHKPYPHNLLQAEALLTAHPDSALTLLNSIKEQIEQEPASTKMYYNLLLTEACDKCDIPYSNDSLIPAITRYYEQKNEKDKLMKSYYFMGKRHLEFQTEDDPAACSYFFQALNASAESKDYAFIAQIHLQISKPLLFMNVPPTTVLQEVKTAYHYFQLGEDKLGGFNALQRLAEIYDSLHQTDSALHYYQKAYEQANKYEGIKESAASLQGLANIYIQAGNIRKAEEILHKVTTKQKEEYLNYNIWGNFFLKTAQLDSATYYYTKATEKNNLSEKEDAYRKLFQIEKGCHNYEQGLHYLEKYTQYSDSIYKSSNIHSLQKIKALYDSHLVELEKEALRKENTEQRSWIIGIMFTLAIITGLFIQYYRIKKVEIQKQKEKLQKVYEEQYLKSQKHMEDNQKKIHELENMIKSIQHEKGNLQRELLLIQKEKLQQTNQAIKTSQKEQALLEESLRKSEIYAYCYRSIEDSSIILTDADWKKLIEVINETYDGFSNRLFRLHPSITAMELHICLLLKIKIPTSAISQLVCRTQSAISMSRKQLYKKIFNKEGKPTQLDEFIISF